MIRMIYSNKLLAFCLLLSSIFVGLSAYAAPSTALADSAYAQRRYDESLAIYDSVIVAEGVSPQLYFNIGNACYKKGDTGNAVIAYLRALRLDPSLNEAKDNLSFLRSHVEDLNRAELKGKKGDVAPDSPSFWTELYQAVAINHLSNTWATWAVVAFLLFIAAVAVYIWSGTVLVKKIGFFGSFICLAAAALFVVFAFSAASAWKSTDKGVVIDNKFALVKSPGSAEAVSIPLHAGTELSVIATSDKKDSGLWFHVRLNSDINGWIPETAFATVVAPESIAD